VGGTEGAVGGEGDVSIFVALVPPVEMREGGREGGVLPSFLQKRPVGVFVHPEHRPWSLPTKQEWREGGREGGQDIRCEEEPCLQARVIHFEGVVRGRKGREGGREGERERGRNVP